MRRLGERTVAFVEGNTFRGAPIWKGNPRGWTIHISDGSMILCPLDLCCVKPKVGEVVELSYDGVSFRVLGIKIGGRVYQDTLATLQEP